MKILSQTANMVMRQKKMDGVLFIWITQKKQHAKKNAYKPCLVH